jgi:hypothetical protein
MVGRALREPEGPFGQLVDDVIVISHLGIKDRKFFEAHLGN